MVNRRTVLKGAIGAAVAGLIPAGLASSKGSDIQRLNPVFHTDNKYFTITTIKKQIQQVLRAFAFEPNDQITRNAITSVLTDMMDNLVEKRVVYEYIVVCDSCNNTPATIDSNELIVDVAVKLVSHPSFVQIRSLVTANGINIQPALG